SGSSADFDLKAADKDRLSVNGNLTVNGATTINLIDAFFGLANGTYALISYTGNLVGSFGNLALGTTPSGPNFALLNNANEVDLAISGSYNNLTWVGNVNGTWDVNTSANWDSNRTFHNGDVVSFDDTA